MRQLCLLFSYRPNAYFNPRTPYGMRRVKSGTDSFIIIISIHAPLTGCDYCLIVANAELEKFQSTHPLRDATQSVADKSNERKDFNPRTPYGMRLYLALIKTLSPIYFNPRTPYGMRLVKSAFYYAVKKISIHAPLTGCDVIDQMPEEMQKISIHAPLTGCD